MDRIKTQTLYVTTDQIFSTPSSYLGSSFVNQFTKFGRTFQVCAEAISRPLADQPVDLYPSATIIGLPAAGYSSGQSMALMQEIATKTLPLGAGYEWTAMSYQEKAVGGQIYWAFGLACYWFTWCSLDDMKAGTRQFRSSRPCRRVPWPNAGVVGTEDRQ